MNWVQCERTTESFQNQNDSFRGKKAASKTVWSEGKQIKNCVAKMIVCKLLTNYDMILSCNFGVNEPTGSCNFVSL